jgi:tripartite-type tricarboxylate transporter receptor subunit TctC
MNAPPLTSLAYRFFAPVLVCLAMLLPPPAAAQSDFPQKPIRLIVPQAPGSATDFLARLLAAEIEPMLNTKVVVENKPGAVFTVGLDLVAKAAPDGYTIGMGPVGALAISPNLLRNKPYDIARDFQPICLLTRGHLALVVSPKSPIHSVRELIALAKQNPGKLSNASSGNGSPGHVGGELFKFMTGTNIVHVPYRGGSAALNDVLAGRVDFMFESLNSMGPQIKAGNVRALALSGARRSPAFPELPTVAEAGVPGYDAPTWSGVIGPAGMPRPILMKLNEAMNRAILLPAFQKRFGELGDEGAGGTPEEFAEFIAKESAKWADVVKRAKIELR